MLIQLQYLNTKGDHCGGLYVNTDHIVSIRFDRDATCDRCRCKMLVSSGIEYIIAGGFSDIVEAVREITNQSTQ